MSVSVDGFIADREGAFGWTVPSEELFRFHISQVRELGGYLLGRRLYETMLPWGTDPSMRDNELWDVFADVWCAIPKVVFSRTLDSVQGNARLAEGGGRGDRCGARRDGQGRLDRRSRPGCGSDSASSASCASSAFRSSSVEGTPFLPPVTEVVP